MAARTLAAAALLALVALSLPTSSRAAITITGFAYGSEGPAVTGMTIEDFEDVSLVSGLTIRMGGGITPVMWSGTIPPTWNPATASSCCSLGGPFPANTWDGSNALCNGGFGTGVSGLSPHTGNYWDFSFADSVYFLLPPATMKFGVGLSNLQSIGGPVAVTNHELIVNGVSRGTLESLLPGYVPGVNVRFRYLVVTATAPDVIQSVCVQNVSALDGLVFDKLAYQLDQSSAGRRDTWGHLKSIYR